MQTNNEEIISMVHQAEVGNIFDLLIFRAIDGATTPCANLTLWNRARHDELVEYLDRRPYGNVVLYSKRSHVEYEPTQPVITDEHVTSTKDRRPHFYTYEEPQVGDAQSMLQAWTMRRRTPKQRRVYEKTVTGIRRQHTEPLHTNVPHARVSHMRAGQTSPRPHVRHRVRFAPYPPTDSGSEQPQTPPMRDPAPTVDALQPAVDATQPAENPEPDAVITHAEEEEEDWN